MAWWYVSTSGWTCAIETTDEKPYAIRTTPPKLRRYRGRPLRDLVRVARAEPGWRISPLS